MDESAYYARVGYVIGIEARLLLVLLLCLWTFDMGVCTVVRDRLGIHRLAVEIPEMDVPFLVVVSICLSCRVYEKGRFRGFELQILSLRRPRSRKQEP